MITTEQFLRRSLLAPIVIPLAVCANDGMRTLQGVRDGSPNAFDGKTPLQSFLLVVSLLSLIFGAIPYVWMLVAKWPELCEKRGAELEGMIQELPLRMLPYYWKVMATITVLLLVSIIGASGAAFTLACLVIGTLAIPILGYTYVGITFLLLRLFQALGLVEPGRQP